MKKRNLQSSNIILTWVGVSWVMISLVSLPGLSQSPNPKNTSSSGATPTATGQATTPSPPSSQPIQSPRAASPTGSPPATPPATPVASPKPTPTPNWVQELWKNYGYSVLLALPGLLLLGLVGYGLCLWQKPLWLLSLPTTDKTLLFTSWKIPLGWVKWFKYRSRVLDAWVECHWSTVQEKFLNLSTVEERQIHISLPVQLGKELLDDLSGQALQDVFRHKAAILLITGEGGAGKTSLACQIAVWGLNRELAGHRMLPVLVETELDERKTLIEVIRSQLRSLANQEEPIALELVQKLLQRQRVLVIVDHLSEMAEATRKQCMPDQPDFLINALVVTSRLQEPLGHLPKAVLEPLRIEGGRLSRFMDAYLTQRQKRHLFEDEEYFDYCRRLSRMVGQRNITILLARLYVDQMIELQQGGGGVLSASVPDLMLSYVKRLNQAIEPENQRDLLQVQRDAQIVAWECLKETYRPTVAKTQMVLQALADAEQAEARERLIYLEKRLRLVQTIETGDRVRIILDPLAEYLAAARFVDDLCDSDRAAVAGRVSGEMAPAATAEDRAVVADPSGRWLEFFNSIDQMLEAENETGLIIQGFLLAVRDCCLLRQRQAAIPLAITEELVWKAGENPEKLRQAEEKRRIRLLMAELSAPELEYRLGAAADLAKRAATAGMAIPNLIGMLKNSNQEVEARQAAAKALAEIGNACKTRDSNLSAANGEDGPAVAGADLAGNRQPWAEIVEILLGFLAETREELPLRRSVAEALGVMQAGQPELLAILEDATQPLGLRQGAARAFSLSGGASGEPVPMLIVEQHQGEITTEVKHIPVLRLPLGEGVGMNWVAIPGGEFVMGSPADEEGRDYYQYLSWAAETTGRDVEKQHRVTLAPFWISQYPVTQGQWRFVAGLEMVEQELKLDPSQHKGKHRPVDSVSWDDAQEFCARLSRYTENTYRLPSEAEWEYACRAGTTSPYHFGETISADWANYNTTYTYGDGDTGIYRQGTTEVGLFGLSNRFGLAEMHGNVYEWCADHWHPDYEAAPTDQSPWLQVGEEDNRLRLLRGGSWYDDPAYCRSAFRLRYSRASISDSVGFRVVAASPPRPLVVVH